MDVNQEACPCDLNQAAIEDGTAFDMTFYLIAGEQAAPRVCPNCKQLWTTDNWPSWYQPADPALKPFPPRCPYCHKSVLFKVLPTTGGTKAEKTGMSFISKPESRLWLAEQKARIAQLAEELKTADDQTAFKLLLRTGSTLSRESEDWRCPE